MNFFLLAKIPVKASYIKQNTQNFNKEAG